MVLRKNEHLIRKRSSTRAIHILPKSKKKKKYTADPSFKKKTIWLFYVLSHTGNVLHDLEFVVVRYHTKIMTYERKLCLLLDFRKMKRKKGKKTICLWEKILKWRKDKPEIGRKYLQNIWLNIRLQRTQRTLKTRTKWKQTTQLRNGQID